MDGDQFQDLMHAEVPEYQKSRNRITKYVSNGRPIPTPEFFRAAAAVLQIDELEARELANQPLDSKATESSASQAAASEDGDANFKLLMGHTLWGAVIVLAAQEGRLPKFRVATYADVEGDPVFIDRTQWDKSLPQGKRPSNIGRSAIPGPRTEDSGLHCFSAPMIVKRFLEGADIDAIAIPKLLAEANSSKIKSLARIAITPIPSLLICRKELAAHLKDKAFKRLLPSTLHVGEKPSNADQECGRLDPELGVELVVQSLHPELPNPQFKGWRVALEQKAISDKLLQLGCEIFFGIEGKSQSNSILFDCSTEEMEDLTFSQLAELAKVQFPDDDGLAGVITWEPLATWFMQSSDSLEAFALRSPLKSAMPFVEFELCMRLSDWESIDNRSKQLRRALMQLVDEIDYDLDRFNLGLKGLEDQQLARLSNYFDMCKDGSVDELYPRHSRLENIRNSLYTITFESSPYREFRNKCEQENVNVLT